MASTTILFFVENMAWVFFFYGLSFILLGLFLSLRLRRSVDNYLTRSFWYLAAFSLVHGVQEWVDMFTRIYGSREILIIFASLFGIFSFTILMLFGIELFIAVYDQFSKSKIKKLAFLRGIPLGMLLMYLFLAFANHSLIDLTFRDLGRFSLGFIGSLSTLIALVYLTAKIWQVSPLKTRYGLSIIAFAFLMYTIFGGLVISPVYGIPPQVFRMLSAIFALLGSQLTLSLFIKKR